jgi:hypothetical protein
MGFDVFGGSGHVCASNLDSVPSYDIFSMPARFRLRCPQLEKLNQRFYETTILDNDDGSIEALRDELAALRDAYREQLGPTLIRERDIRVKDPVLRRAVLDRVLNDDVVFRVLTDFVRLCDETIAAALPLRCIGD